jgi:uncharacterized protein (TIGR00251 family)
MILDIRVIPKASKNEIKRENNSLRAYLTKPAQDNLANEQLIELLSEYLQVKKYEIKIIKGRHSRNKSIEIPNVSTNPLKG